MRRKSLMFWEDRGTFLSDLIPLIMLYQEKTPQNTEQLDRQVWLRINFYLPHLVASMLTTKQWSTLNRWHSSQDTFLVRMETPQSQS